MLHRRLGVFVTAVLIVANAPSGATTISESVRSNSVQRTQALYPKQSSMLGKWVGELTQGSSYTYPFRIDVLTEGSTLTGTSRITWGKYYGIMTFTATVENSIVYYTETSIVKQHLPRGHYWCLKTAQLTFYKHVLSGPWGAPDCISGSISVRHHHGT